MCPSPDTEAYPTYGGIWQRTDRYHGRVGSVFEPAGAKVANASEQKSFPGSVPGEPTPADSERQPGTADDRTAPQPPSSDQQPDAAAPLDQDQEQDLDQDVEDIRRRLEQRADVEEIDL